MRELFPPPALNLSFVTFPSPALRLLTAVAQTLFENSPDMLWMMANAKVSEDDDSHPAGRP
jgi:hypothetical protein